MRVVITGATGNLGSSLVERLSREPSVSEIVALSRRPGNLPVDKVRWHGADISISDLEPHLRGADAVIHTAWVVQPSHDEQQLWRVNVEGSARVFAAAAKAGVGALIHASSVGAYSPGPKEPVDESWPTGGVVSSWYSRHKAYCERLLDGVERDHPEMRVVRMRPSLFFKADAATGIRKLFIGPLLPSTLVHPGRVPITPAISGLTVQAAHTSDVTEAFRLALLDGSARGAYNVASGPVLDSSVLSEVLGGPRVPVPAFVAKVGAALSWRARLQPTSPDWLDLALQSPLLDTTRAETELGWKPAVSGPDALRELLGGLAERREYPTPALRA